MSKNNPQRLALLAQTGGTTSEFDLEGGKYMIACDHTWSGGTGTSQLQRKGIGGSAFLAVANIGQTSFTAVVVDLASGTYRFSQSGITTGNYEIVQIQTN